MKKPTVPYHTDPDQCTEKYTVPVFHPTDNTIKADLIIEINAPELTGAIPCHNSS